MGMNPRHAAESVVGQHSRCLPETDEGIRRAAAAIRRGEVVIFPTDTVFGIGTTPFDEQAVLRLYTVKQRPLHKPIPVLLADTTDLAQVTAAVSPIAQGLIDRFWPGPLTLVLPGNHKLPAALSDNGGVAVRIPDRRSTRAMIRLAGGAVAATSANLSGLPPAPSAAKALAQLGEGVALALEGGASFLGMASTVIDCRGSAPRLLRPGPLTAEELAAFLPDL
jgi:tRNA threonylcarbamoyl adenosine modification protein (Sua5/YciO/YrdC/YwlC family)